MIITQILGNIHDLQGKRLVGERHVETVVLPSADLVKRIQRVRTDHDTELGLRLPAGSPDLEDGDILAVEDTPESGNAIVVRVESSDVLVIAPRTILEMGVVAHGLGNRHLPAQFFGEDSEYGQDVMVVQYDHTVSDFLEHHGVPFSRQNRVMPVPFRHAEHTH